MVIGAIPFRDEVVTGIHHTWSMVTGAIPFRDEAGPDADARTSDEAGPDAEARASDEAGPVAEVRASGEADFFGWLVTGIHHNWSMVNGAIPFRDEVL
jgi:hypothetical protein